jgi:hypothetical protein
MSRSQRHKILIENYPSDCKITSEHVISPGYLRQPGPTYTVPMGPAGGPLQGSSLAGPAPSTLPNPQFDIDHPLAVTVLVAAATGGMKPPEPPADTGTTMVYRTFPIGPIALAQVSYDANDGELVFEMASDPNVASVEVGDTVRVEATGTTAVNKDYVVTALSDPPGTFWAAGDDPGNGPIVGKGRVTVIGGA